MSLLIQPLESTEVRSPGVGPEHSCEVRFNIEEVNVESVVSAGKTRGVSVRSINI